ncbi:hypothetical protein GGI22_008104, partial [Coemansia erecta]
MDIAATEAPSTTNPEAIDNKPQITEETQPTETEDARKRNNDKPVVTLVIDTNPLIKGLALDAIASNFVSIPE